MKFEISYFHCGEYLKKTLAEQIEEVKSTVTAIHWVPEFQYEREDISCQHQTAFNRAFVEQFNHHGWETQPILRQKPKLIGDFRKGLVFVEIQFGNSSTLYRDYYKFQYGLANGLLSLAVLIVPMEPKSFFPTRPRSVLNMASYALANTCLNVLPINVPTLLIGLLPEN